MKKSVSNLKIVPKDVVLLHCVDPGKNVPSLSPFVLKLQTYLRMADIDFQIDTKKPFGPSGKTPWITFNGADITDSQIIIEHLNKAFGKNLWGNATEQEIAMSKLTRVAMEEHFAWGLAHWRWITGIDTIDGEMNLSGFKSKILKLVVPRRVKKTLHAQGLGRYPMDKMIQIVGDDLRSLSTILGEKTFFLGDQPTEIDATLFGFLAQVMWSTPGSPYEKLVKDELTNLKHYTIRMKEKFWPDWTECLHKSK